MSCLCIKDRQSNQSEVFVKKTLRSETPRGYMTSRSALFHIATILALLMVIASLSHAQIMAGSSLNVLGFGAKCNGVTDDTAAIQAAINRARASATGATIVIPEGMAGCVVSQLDVTNSQSRIRLVGEASMNGAQSYILCRESSSNAGVCVDFSGTDSFNVENLQIIGGASAATAPRVTVLLGKTIESGGRIGNGSEITWSSVTVNTSGQYGVYNYGGEVWSCMQCYFVGGGVADVVLSDANTAAITSPFASLVSPPTSMTSIHFIGDTFTTVSTAVAVLLDPLPQQGEAPISDIDFSNGYAHLAGPAFIADTGSPTSQGLIQGVRVEGWRTEAYSPTTAFAIFNSVVTQITIDAAYTISQSSVVPLQFNGSWGPYSVSVANINLRPGDWNGAYPPTVVQCHGNTRGVVIHEYLTSAGTPMHNSCLGATQM